MQKNFICTCKAFSPTDSEDSICPGIDQVTFIAAEDDNSPHTIELTTYSLITGHRGSTVNIFHCMIEIYVCIFHNHLLSTPRIKTDLVRLWTVLLNIKGREIIIVIVL